MLLAPLLAPLALAAPASFQQPDLWLLGPELPAGAPAIDEVDQRTALIDLGALDWTVAPVGAHTVSVPLFDGSGIEFQLQRRGTLSAGSVWFGTTGVPGQQLTLAVQAGIAHGTLRDGEQLYQLRFDPQLGQLLALAAPERFLPCGCGAEHAVSSPVVDGDAPTALAAAAGVTLFDILVAYTPATRAASGGTAGVESLIALAELQTNQSYANAAAPVGIRVVHSYETPYTENGSSGTDLSRFRNTSDGIMDEVHSLRDTFGADACTLLTNSGSACGVGYLMTNVSNNFKSSAFNVTLRGCATGNLTFGHELGHNFGCAHDRANAGGASRPYAYGYRTPGNQYRSVMAYSPGTRAPIMSGPLGVWNGFTMGIANSEDNARAVTENAPTIAGWRTSQTGIVDCDGNGVDDNFEIAIGAGTDSDGNGILDICQDFGADIARIPIFTGGTQNLSLNADPSFAGATYLILGSFSGSAPATPVHGVDVPLVVDNYTLFTLNNVNSGILNNTFGSLDSQAQGSAAIQIPGGLLPPTYVFKIATHAYLLLDSAGTVIHASTPITLGFEIG